MLCFTKKYLSCLLRVDRLAMVVAVVALAAPSSDAGVYPFDQNVTSNVIMGSGVTNGAFTVNRSSADRIELGLRAKVRFNASNQPENTFNSNGDGTYTFEPGQPAGGGFSFEPNSSSTAKWNFEWSINSDFEGDGVTSPRSLSALTYLLEIDLDPATDFNPMPGDNYLAFDPINTSYADHAIGDNGTGPGAGVKAADATAYGDLIASNNLAQNSWNLEFFNDASHPFDANVPGVFDIILTAFDNGAVIAQTQIQINTNAVPEPASLLAFGGLGLCVCTMGLRRKRRRTLRA
ncbi:hypothetical protein K227x_46560 [Rubripirellula lacrimiformis]|uniref:Uncharacterized protein n=1 Tax=Rubripirellula lacrimiformis TaxID=1930273 RepID=A0A517NGI4_9BACT|nr:PEP-CTERM sorting domain-containing protein [Rubripirellula lacrimiformis]QDT06247.1 hypothetical protein K227x_46560 [Rubripirellula lacrimiformis]